MIKLDKQNLEDILGLTPIQEGLLFHYLKNPQSDEYFEQICLGILGRVDAGLFTKAWDAVVQTNEQLRTLFRWEKVKTPVQIVLKEHTPHIKIIDLTHKSESEKNILLEEIKVKDREKKFNLREIPFRVTLCILAEERHEMIISNHHIIYDGWSNGIILKEFLNAYRCLSESETYNLPTKKKYKDFIKYIQKQDKEGQKVFWQEYLKGFNSQNRLEVTKKKHKSIRKDHQYRIQFSRDKLEGFAKGNEVTLAALVYSLWGIVLQKNHNIDDIIFGATISGRAGTFNGIEEMVGLFINTVPLRVKKDSGETSIELIKKLNKTLQDWELYGTSSLVDIKKYSELDTEIDLFDTIVVFENYPLDQTILTNKNRIALNSYSTFEMTNYGLSISISLHKDIEICFSYNEQLYESSKIERLAQHFTIIAEAVIKNPHKKIEEIDIVSIEEKKQILLEFNNTRKTYSHQLTISQLFEQQAMKTPDNVAIVYKNRTMTYEELNDISNNLSNELLRKGVKKGEIIGIMTDPSIEMLIGIIAILKVGAAYLPIDPEYPESRKMYMIQDSQTKFILTSKDVINKNDYVIGKFNNDCIFILDNSRKISGETLLPKVNLSPNDLFTVLYTSGTTGKPKGVMIENRNVVNLVQWFGKTFNITEKTNLLQLTNYVFDPSIEDFFGTLLYGATLHIAEKNLILNKKHFCDYVDQHEIHIINFIPTVLKELLCHDRKLQSLHTVISGGERLEESLKNGLIDRGYKLYNNYGPAETTVDALSVECSENTVSLGRPISNVRCYILDKDKNISPIGVPGELYIAGDGVGRGYLNLPEFTNEKFMNDPFNPNDRMYKTGDLGRWLPNGEIEFLGREDHQVKIRGYRIELSEIHNLILKRNYIEDVAVIDWEINNGKKVICAYIVSHVQVNMEELKGFLAKELPDYMLPSYYIQLESLPLTSIGKLDRRNLPAPQIHTYKGYVAPKNKVQEELVEVWSAVLGLHQGEIGIHDNFFELGGDSILSIQIVGKALQKGIEITVSQMFENQTIAELADCIADIKESYSEDQIEEPETGEVLLTPIQKWFFEQDLENYHHWNQSVLLETRAGINPNLLHESFRILTNYHDSFRLRYYQRAGEWIQVYSESDENVLFELHDFNNSHMHEILSKLQYELNITDGPLIKVAYFDSGDQEKGRLFITVHHLVIDGYSWRLMLDTLQMIYEQLTNSGSVQLPVKGLSFKKWSEHLYEYAYSNQLKDELAFWKNNVPSSVNTIPIDMEGGRNDENSARTLSFMLTEKETKYLLHDTYQLFKMRIDDILLSALSSTLANWSGETLVDLEGHGRNPLLKEYDTSRTVGWFTCVYPIVMGDIEKEKGIAEILKQVKERYRAIPNGGIGYEILYYLAEKEMRGQISSRKRGQISFNYLGQFEQAIKKQQLFNIADVNTGPTRDLNGIRSHLLEIECMIVDKKLCVEWKYSANSHLVETIQGLAKDFVNNLKNIIDHCQTKEGTYLTPSDFPLVSIDQKKIDEWIEVYKNIEDIYMLSPVQQSMVFHHIYSPKSSVTVEQTIFSIKSKLDIEIFEKAWQKLLDRHESLRTSYHWEGLEEAVQIVHKDLKIPFQVLDWTNFSKSEGLQKLEQLIEEDRKKGFDLSKPPLMRILVIKQEEYAYDVVWTHHHLQLDGWCNSILFKELGQCYEALCVDEKITFGHVYSFKDYIDWLRRQDKKKAEQFWRTELDGFKTPIRFNNIFPAKNSNQLSAFGDVVYEVSEDKQQIIQDFTRKNRITLNTMIQGAWAILLNRYSQETDIIFGVTSSGRPAELEGSDSIIGCFMNTLPFRVKINKNVNLIKWLKDVQLKQVEMRQYEYTSLVDIRSWIDMPRSSALYDLYESIVIVENYPFDVKLKDGIGSLQVKSVRIDEQMDYPLVVYCNLQPKLQLKLLFNSSFLNETEANQILSHLINILWEMLVSEDGKLENISMISEKELTHILSDNNSTSLDYPKNQCFQDLFTDQVKLNLNKPAVIQGNESLSYTELDILSNQLAHKLIKLGVGPEIPVGVYVERSPKMIVGILAVLKAGGAFLPIDMDYPGERINLMLKDAQVPILLTQNNLQSKIRDYQGHTVCLDIEWDSVREEPKNQPSVRIEPQNLAYIIYTSGSTGRPKGVMMSHEAVVSHSIDICKRYELTPEDRVLQFSSISFDISLEQIFTTLAAGSSLVLRDKNIWTPYQFSQKCVELGLSVVNLPTNYWGEIVQEWYTRPEIIPDSNLRLVIVGGEQMPAEKVGMWEQLPLEDIILLNAYGPAETAMTSTLYEVSGKGTKSADLKVIPVGKPLANRRIYILDENMHPLPIGVKGEIFIGGIPLARGYINNSKLTKDKFIRDPYYHNYGKMLYKTGDMGKLLCDGNIEVLGRKDDQTKIRGHRIDIGEIEVVLNKCDNIKNSIVVVKNGVANDKYLVAFYDSLSHGTNNQCSIRGFLRKKLPEYMIPSYFIQLGSLPLSPNGKIDRKSLENMEIKVEFDEEYQKPYNTIQQKLVSIWRKILGTDGVGINHHFFEIGGQSLKAITLVSEIHREFEVELPLGNIFAFPTIKELAVIIEEMMGKKETYEAIRLAPPQEYYEVSPAQKSMYIVSQLNGASTNYNITGAVFLEGEVNIVQIEKALQALINRHESLRTSFKQVQGKIVQKIHQNPEWNMQHLYADEQNFESVVETFIRPFDLEKGPLFRAAIVEVLPSSKYLLVYDMHHIISDGLSMGILIREFASLYQKNNLPDVRIQYKDFSNWQNKMIESGNWKLKELYWLEIFSKEIPLLNLPTDYPRLDEPMFEGDVVQFNLDAYYTSKLNEISSRKGATLYSLLLSAFNILLFKYSGQEDIIIGSPVAGRLNSELENVVGMFVNTLALRNYPTSEKRFEDFLKEVASHTLQALEHQEYSFEMLVDKLQLRKNVNRHPLFDVMFAFENVDAVRAEIGDFEIKPYEYTNRTSKFDLELKVTEQDGQLRFIFEYSTGLFRKETIERMAEHFVKIMDTIIEDITIPIEEIDLVTMKEKNRIGVFNNTDTLYPEEKTIKRIFEELVEKHPNRTAVVFGQRTITYKELNDKANQLAKHLIKKGAGSDTVIALLAEPSIEMIIGLWSIIKSGAIYLPLDPEFPLERINSMIEDSDTILLLTQSHLVTSNDFTCEVMELEDKSLFFECPSNIEERSTVDNPIYIIYTSGTTGLPKGVPIKNQSLVNYISWFTREASITYRDKTLLLSSFAFDLGYTSLYTALLNGCELHLVPKEHYMLPETLITYLKEKKISYIKLTPSLFNYLVNHRMVEDYENCMALRLIVLGGEEVKSADISKFNRVYPQTVIMNHYGPTETTIGALFHKFNATDFDLVSKGTVIGKPVDNTKIFILDRGQKLVPLGMAGEICIGGVGVTEGYLNQIDLNSEKFITVSPLGHEKIKLYRTGDLGRLTCHQEVEFLGRIDNQLKIRGYRVELEEINSVLLQHDMILDAIVVPKKDKENNNILCAYIVLKENENGWGIREYLSSKIPYYMMPSIFIKLDRIPLTPNGKLNVKALPEIKDELLIKTNYELPEDPIEKTVAQMWEETLNVKQISMNDSFFEMGGNSLSLMLLMAEIHKKFSVDISLREAFKAPTVRGISKHIKKRSESKYVSLQPVEKCEYYDLSSAQKRIYTLQQMEGIGTSYNMPRATLLEGEINLDKLEKAFCEIVKRHEAFQTSIEVVDGVPKQRIQGEVDIEISYSVLDEHLCSNPSSKLNVELENIIDEFIEPFDLSKAPLVRVRIIRLSSHKHVLLTDMHHLISDGYSVNILLQELSELYQGKLLQENPIQYKEFVYWQNEFLKTSAASIQEKYWLDVLSGDLPVLDMPTDFPRPIIQSFEGNSFIFEGGNELKQRLDNLCLETDTTLYMILSVAYSILLSKCSSQHDIIVGMPILGRTHSDLKNIIGMFANTIAIRSFPIEKKNFTEFLSEIKEQLIKAYDNQDYQFDMIIDKLKIKRDLGRNPIFSTMLAFQESQINESIMGNLKMTPVQYRNKISKFDLTLFVEKGKKELFFEFEYASSLYRMETIKKLAENFLGILDTISSNKEIKLENIEIEGLVIENTEIENVKFNF